MLAMAEEVKQTMLKFDEVLGVMHHEKGTIDEDIQALVDKREQARKDKDFKEADKIRDELKEKGFTIEDSAYGPRLKKL